MCPPQADLQSLHPSQTIAFLIDMPTSHDNGVQCMCCIRRRLQSFVESFPEAKDLAVEMYSETFPYSKSLEFFL